ncbi:MAG: AAA family ATPase [Acidobacteriota bacterium]
MDRYETDTAVAEPELPEDADVAETGTPSVEAGTPSVEAGTPGVEAGGETDNTSRSAAAEPSLATTGAESVPATPEPAASVPPPPAADPLADAMVVMERLQARMRAQIIGRDDVIDLVLVALLSDGHVLLEDFPGSGKTTLAKALGSSIIKDLDEGDIADFRRIQFTPDLLPSDVTGVSVFDPVANRFHFRHGPIFAHVVLADEINRTSPKVQSAMLEAMAEKQVTVDNQTFPLDELFFVIATQNPLDLAGTYPLPVAQLDRFLFKIRMVHIDRQAELEVLETYRQRRDTHRVDLPKVTRSEVLAARRAIDQHVAIDGQVKECLVDIAQAIREDERVLQGNSTRSLVLILPALQALAVLRGRDYVAAEDIQTLIPRVLGHRVDLAPGITELEVVLEEAMERSIEGLARSTMRRR